MAGPRPDGGDCTASGAASGWVEVSASPRQLPILPPLTLRQARWPHLLSLRRLRQEGHKFKASLARPVSK